MLGEAAVSHLLEESGINHEWKGGEGEVDMRIEQNGVEIDVKTRSSDCKYRNLIKSYRTDQDVDFYILCNAQKHPLTGDVVAIEVLGYISDEDAERHGTECEIPGSDNVHDKIEVDPEHMTPITDMLYLLG